MVIKFADGSLRRIQRAMGKVFPLPVPAATKASHPFESAKTMCNCISLKLLLYRITLHSQVERLDEIWNQLPSLVVILWPGIKTYIANTNVNRVDFFCVLQHLTLLWLCPRLPNRANTH